MSDTTWVPMGKTQYFPLGHSGAKYGSKGFNGCLGAMVIGKRGTIIGHYACNINDIENQMALLDGETCSIGNSNAAVNAIPEYWEQYRESFREELKTYVYVPKIPGNQSMVDRLIEIITETTQSLPEVRSYSQDTAIKGKARFTVKYTRMRKTKVKFSS